MSERRLVATIRVAVTLLLAVALATVLVGFGLSRVVPLTGHRSLMIDGRSMEPTIPLGSVVVVEPVEPSLIRVGDIVSVQSAASSAVFTHRVTRLVDEEGRRLLATKGDGNAAEDPVLVPASAAIGRVAWSAPFLGYLLAYLSLPSGTIFFICLGATLIVALFVLDEWQAEIVEEEALERRLRRGGLEPA